MKDYVGMIKNNPTFDEDEKDNVQPISDELKINTKVKISVARVNATAAAFRENASEKSKVIGTILDDSEVELIEDVDKTWSKISYNNVEGYVKTEFTVEV